MAIPEAMLRAIYFKNSSHLRTNSPCFHFDGSSVKTVKRNPKFICYEPATVTTALEIKESQYLPQGQL